MTGCFLSFDPSACSSALVGGGPGAWLIVLIWSFPGGGRESDRKRAIRPGMPEPFPNVHTGGSAIQNPNSRRDRETLCLLQGAFDKMEFGLCPAARFMKKPTSPSCATWLQRFLGVEAPWSTILRMGLTVPEEIWTQKVMWNNGVMKIQMALLGLKKP